MRILSCLPLALLLGCGSAAAPADPPAAPSSGAEVAAPAAARSLNAWRVRSPGGAESVLVGSYHLGVSLDEALPGVVAELDAARVLVLEVDTDPAALAADPGFTQSLMLPEGQDLQHLLPPELWPKLRERFPAMPEPMLRRLAPWAVMSMVMAAESTDAEVRRTGGSGGGDGPSMLDMQARARAAERGVPTRGLETMEEQVEMMRAIPVEHHVEYLRGALLTPEDSQRDTDEAMDAYVSGDADAIEASAMEDFADAPELYEALIVDRNVRWLEPLIAELERGQAFVVVGLLHVVGDRGLLALLGERGYDVERLTAPAP